MADDERRGFLKKQVGGGAAFAVGLLTGGAVGAAGLHTYRKAARPFADQARHSYAQQGEDLVLDNIFLHLDMRGITYLDVGAHHPVVSNNTFYFYERGSQGVLVEPNPALWGVLSEVRPRDVLIRGGIGIEGKDTEADYYVIYGDGEVNTFSKEMVDKYVALANGANPVKEVIRLPLLDINGLMQKHFSGAPLLLSLDTEGFELPILRSIDWKRYRPAVVCVDTLEFGTKKQRVPILKLMAANGYLIRGATFVNTIFVDRKYL